MVVLLAGRAAEEVVFGEVSTGAADDLAKVTDIARQSPVQTRRLEWSPSRNSSIARPAHGSRVSAQLPATTSSWSRLSTTISAPCWRNASAW